MAKLYCSIFAFCILTAIILLECSTKVDSKTCYFRRYRITYIRYERRYRVSRRVTYYACGLWSRCTRYYLQYYYYTSSVYSPSITYYSVYGCCTGYHDPVPGDGTLKCVPTCAGGCNGGTCNSPGSCTCISGWSGSLCQTDINECAVNNGGCHHHCTNTNGSYTCSCNTNFSLSHDNKTCADINECLGEAKSYCQHLCVNTPGGYHCECHNGYKLSTNGKNCSDINECDSQNGGCQYNCTNTISSYYCNCPTGHVLNKDNKTCSDINECHTNNGGCHQTCINTAGSYYCQCNEGYELGRDRHSCTANPCPTLKAPSGGHMTCSGQQVTNENCTFTCNTGYKQEGSELRKCLPNSTWTGTLTTCQLLYCPLPKTTKESSVIYPCHNTYQRNCSLICLPGYHISNDDDNKWEQSCSVLTDNDTLVWTGVETCEERNICQPNPCSPGRCNKTSVDQFTCNCTGSYHLGLRCHIGYITSDSFPVLRVGESTSLYIYSNPLKELRLLINASTDLGLRASNSYMLRPNEGNLKFLMTPIKSGLFIINYHIISSQYHYITPDESIVLVRPKQDRRSSNSYFKRYGLQEGQLGVGCCSLKYSLPLSACPASNDVTLMSTCQWSSQMNTKGIVFVNIALSFLPLSLAGYNLEKKSIYYNRNENCTSCSNGNKNCYSSNDISISTDIINELLSYNSLFNTFLNNTKHLHPSWLTVQTNNSNMPNKYSKNDFLASFTTWKDTSQVIGCDSLSFNNPSHYVYAIRTTSNLILTINSTLINLNSSISQPLCILYDACSTRSGSIHVSIPSSLQSSLLTQLPLINRFVSQNTRLLFYNMTMKDGGVPVRIDTLYWNGSTLIRPSRLNYEYDLFVSLVKSFNGGRYLNVNMTFIGSVLYNSSISHGQVPGALVGRGMIDIATTINQNLFNIQMSFEQPAIFNFPGTLSSHVSSLLPLGLAFYTTELQSTCSSSKSICIYNNSTSRCVIYTMLQLDESFNVISLSLTSNCIWIYLYDLKLTYGFNHTITLFSNSKQGQPSMTLISKVTMPYIEFGQFLKLQSTSQKPSVISIDFSPTSDTVSGAITNVNVTLFDTQFITNLTISNDMLMFKKNMTIFGFDVFIFCSSSLRYNSTNIPLEIQGIFTSSEIGNISTKFNNLFKLEVSDLRSRLTHVTKSLKKAQKWFNNITNQTILKRNQLTQAELQFNESIIKHNQTKLQFDDIFESLIGALDDNYNTSYATSNFDSICDDDTLCISGLKCNTCNRSYSLNISYKCPHIANKEVFSNYYVPVREWTIANQCYDILKVKWSSLYYVSKERQCRINRNLPFSYTINENRRNNNIVKTSCNDMLFTDSSNTTQICCEHSKCLYTIKNNNCFQKYREFYSNITNKFNVGNFDLLFNDFLNKLTLFEESSRELFQKQVLLNHTKMEYEMISTVYDTSLKSLQQNIITNQSLHQKLSFFHPFIDVVDVEETSSEYVKINNITILLNDTSTVGATLPLTIEVELLHTRRILTFNVSVNVLAPKEILSNKIALYVLESVVSASNKVTYKSLQTPEQCYIEEPLKLYINQLEKSLQLSYQDLTNTKNGLYLNTNNISLAYQEKAVQFFNNLSFPLWQIGMEKLHVNVSKLEPFGCASFTECLVAASTITEYVLLENNVINNIINEVKTQLPQISYNKSLTFQEAISFVQKLQTILKTLHFCDEAHTVKITYQKSTLDLIQNTHFSLTCESSPLNHNNNNLHYYWTKNSVILPHSNTSKYTIASVQITDNGYYQCIGYNDRGYSLSNTVLVQVHSVPTLSIILPPVMNIHERVDNIVHLVCDSKALPSPKWKWFYSSTGNSLLEITGATSNVYTISNVTSSHQGWYQCLAYNVITNDTCRPVHLRVLPSVVTRIKYEMTLNFNLNQNGGNYHDFDVSNALKRYFKEQIDSKSTNVLSNNTISRTDYGTNIRIFSIQITTPFILTNTLSNISSQLNIFSQQLNNDRNRLVGHFQEERNFYFAIQNYLIQFNVNSFQIGSRTFVCPSGYELHTEHAFCVVCKAGHYSSNETITIISTGEKEELAPQCISCPIGTYQVEYGSHSCVQCPNGYSTNGTGSTLASDCKELCRPNTYSLTGFTPCDACPSAHYQPKHGQRICLQENTLSSISTVQSVTAFSEYTSTSIVKRPSHTITAQPKTSVNSAAITVPVIFLIIIIILIAIGVIIGLVLMRNKRKVTQEQEQVHVNNENISDMNNLNPCYGPRHPDMMELFTIDNQFATLQQEDTLKKYRSCDNFDDTFEKGNFDNIFEKGKNDNFDDIFEKGVYNSVDDLIEENIYETLSTYSKEEDDYI